MGAKQFTVEVLEVREVRCLYTVTAEDEHEAKEKAQDGDANDVHEINGFTGIVTERRVLRPPEFQCDLE